MALNAVNQHKGGIVRPARNNANAYDSTDPLGQATGGSAPNAITDLTLDSIGSVSAGLSWTLPANTDNVEVYRRNVTTSGSFALITTLGAVTSHNATGLSSSTEYEWKVVATNANGSSADSNVVSGTTSASQLPGSTQLSEGNFSPRNVDPILIYPRPDSETAVWAKHRRHLPGVPYRCPIGVAFGSGPQVFEVIDGPPGAYIGEFLVVDGDVLVVNEDYGVFKVDSPTAGTYPCHVRVHFQDGFTPIDVQWSLEVTTNGTIVLDTVGGDDATGDGTIGNPFQTIEAWWKSDLSDTTYSGYQVCYRGGTYDAAAGETVGINEVGNWQLNGTDKPLVHYPYPGETVTFDMTNATIGIGGAAPVGGGQHGSDMYFGDFVYLNSRGATTDNPRHFFLFAAVASDKTYTPGGAGQRMTWDSPTHKDFVVETTSENNAGPLWATKAEGVNPDKRHFIYIHRPTFDNCRMSATATNPANQNLNGYYFSSVTNLLSDHITCINTEFGLAPIHSKSGGRYWCIRWVDMTQAEEQPFNFEMLSSYDLVSGGPMELSYVKSPVTLTDTPAVNMYINNSAEAYDGQNPEHLPAYIVRCNLSRAPVTNRSALRVGGGWPYELIDSVFVADDLIYLIDPDPTGDFLRYDVADNPFDASLNWINRASLGAYGAEVKNEEA